MKYLIVFELQEDVDSFHCKYGLDSIHSKLESAKIRLELLQKRNEEKIDPKPNYWIATFNNESKIIFST
jgi:hypothetical protein